MIELVQKDKQEYTNIHLPYVRLCFQAKCFQHSLKHLELPVCKFHSAPAEDRDFYMEREGVNIKILQIEESMNEKQAVQKQVGQIISFFYYRGMIMQHLERLEDCFSSYVRALSVPYSNIDNEYFQVMVVAYNKVILFHKLVQLYQGVPESEQDLRTSLNLQSNLHFVNQQNLQELSSHKSCRPYQELSNALRKEQDRIKLRPSHSKKKSVAENAQDLHEMTMSVNDCIQIFGDQSYKPNWDMRFVLELKHNKDVITCISKLRDVFSCVKIDKIN